MKKKWTLKKFKELFMNPGQDHWEFNLKVLVPGLEKRGEPWSECMAWHFTSEYYRIHIYFILKTQKVFVEIETAFEQVIYELPYFTSEAIGKLDIIARSCKALEDTINVMIPIESWKKKVFSDYE